ncbi:MAG: hypothetical protein ACR2GB_05915, partial [Nocardioidaceae bacterium]
FLGRFTASFQLAPTVLLGFPRRFFGLHESIDEHSDKPQRQDGERQAEARLDTSSRLGLVLFEHSFNYT